MASSGCFDVFYQLPIKVSNDFLELFNLIEVRKENKSRGERDARQQTISVGPALYPKYNH